VFPAAGRDLKFMSSQSADEILRLEFNDWARAGRGERMERGHRPVGEQAIARMRVESEARILDLGCGTGWATRLFAEQATGGTVIGVDVSDEMVRMAESASADFPNAGFRLASAESLPFEDGYFSHVFSMESLYYYENMGRAVAEVHRVLRPRGLFVAVVDLFEENEPSHQWVEQLKVPVHLLSTAQYRALFEQAGFAEVSDERLYDPTPVPFEYTGGSFQTREDYLRYKEIGSLMLSGRVKT
jgi:ubiquinone/menaquinone biosynthesis C-methylase UbiE